jgi:hypothetical protein
MKKIILIALILKLSLISNAQNSKWLLNIELPDVGNIETVMNFEFADSSFVAYSRESVVSKILGWGTYTFGKIFTTRFNKKGSLLYINKGKFITQNDTIRLSGNLSSLLGDFDIKANIVRGKFQGYLQIEGKTTTIEGEIFKSSFPLNNYTTVFNELIDSTQKYIYDSTLLETKKWRTFNQKMRELIPKIQTDLELIVAFSHHAGKLPFSHFSLLKKSTFEMNTPEEPQLALKTKNKTAHLDIASFMGTVSEIDSFMNIIKEGGYKHLIVDLRYNGGGSVAPGLAFARHVVDSSFYGGVLLSRKWFNQHTTLPKIEDYPSFPIFSESNLELLIKDIHIKEAICLKVIPKETTFSGNLYILTNKYTGSTCEPIVYGLKQNKRAIIIGEKTAGAMLSAETFQLCCGFNLFIPTATYYTSDGYKIDKNGVKPTINVKSQNAWKFIKKKLKKNQYN